MDNFGLGLILNFTDNASSGMSLAIGNFRRMSGAADDMVKSLGESGKAFQSLESAGVIMTLTGNIAKSMGDTIVNAFASVSDSIINVGSDFEKTRITLAQLFNSASVGEEKVQWMINYAKTTPFDITSLKEAFVALKAMGVDSSQTVQELNGQSQALLSYVGDLKAYRPDLDMSTIVRGLRNAAGGTIRSLDMIMDINSTKLLGHTFQDIATDLPALVQALGVEGLMGKLNGTWEQMVSNMSEVWLQFELAVSDAGFFDKAKGIIGGLYNKLMSISNEDFAAIGKTISDAFDVIAKPVGFLVDQIGNLMMQIVELSKEHPTIVQFGLIFTALAGGVLFATGYVLNFIGPMITAVGVMGMFIQNAGGMSKVLGDITKSLGPVGTAFKIITVLIVAYETNFLCFRDFINGTVAPAFENLSLIIKGVFSYSSLTGDELSKINQNGLMPMISSLTNLKDSVS